MLSEEQKKTIIEFYSSRNLFHGANSIQQVNLCKSLSSALGFDFKLNTHGRNYNHCCDIELIIDDKGSLLPDENEIHSGSYLIFVLQFSDVLPIAIYFINKKNVSEDIPVYVDDLSKISESCRRFIDMALDVIKKANWQVFSETELSEPAVFIHSALPQLKYTPATYELLIGSLDLYNALNL